VAQAVSPQILRRWHRVWKGLDPIPHVVPNGDADDPTINFTGNDGPSNDCWLD
jgi:hypothetical protein